MTHELDEFWIDELKSVLKVARREREELEARIANYEYRIDQLNTLIGRTTDELWQAGVIVTSVSLPRIKTMRRIKPLTIIIPDEQNPHKQFD